MSAKAVLWRLKSPLQSLFMDLSNISFKHGGSKSSSVLWCWWVSYDLPAARVIAPTAVMKRLDYCGLYIRIFQKGKVSESQAVRQVCICLHSLAFSVQLELKWDWIGKTSILHQLFCHILIVNEWTFHISQPTVYDEHKSIALCVHYRSKVCLILTHSWFAKHDCIHVAVPSVPQHEEW